MGRRIPKKYDVQVTQRPRTSTSLNLDADLWSRIRIIAVRRRIAYTELVEEALWQAVLKFEDED
jgi:predicted DNA-binding ribbon-helix-helix protein